MVDGFWDLAAEDALKRLQADCGSDWMVWYVPCWDGHQRWLTWCARRHTDGALLHATSRNTWPGTSPPPAKLPPQRRTK